MRFTRVTLFFIAFIISLGFYQLAVHFLSDVEPQTFQATEEVMVDVANLLAELVENDMQHDQLDTEHLRAVFDGVHERTFHAQIFDHLKEHVGINAYLTDSKGIVIFDSDGGRREGKDLSRYKDVADTLKGLYGSRCTREVEGDSATSILYISAPVGDKEHPAGVLTVFKPKADALPMVRKRKQIIYWACGMIGGGILFLIGVVFLWLFNPLKKITEYARSIERGERPKLPKLGIGREVNTLAHALESMRQALEGRSYAEHYIQTLTHEMKSPLAAIKGAAELLDEEMPTETRRRFLGNIRAETERTERLINRLLELSAIESKTHLDAGETLDLRTIVARAIDQAKPLADLAGVALEHTSPDSEIRIHGDAFILRAAITNLLENAIDFSPRGGAIEIGITSDEDWTTLTIRDHGPGIPDYAQARVFERFYSLRHHTSGRKGTGLGLTLVREAADVHGGTISLDPAEGGGTLAMLRLPSSR